MASKLKSTLFRSSLSLILLLLSSASLAPIFVLRNPPTSFGWALATVSAITLLSSLIGFYSQLTLYCFVTHISIALASLVGQVLGFLSLFLQHNSTRSLIASQRDNKEVWILMFSLELSFVCMALVQFFVLVLGCVAEKRWKRQCEEVELGRDETAKKSKRTARVQQEELVNAKSEESNENMKGKYGKWAKNDIERC